MDLIGACIGHVSIDKVNILSNVSYSGRESVSFWLFLSSAVGGLVIMLLGIIFSFVIINIFIVE